MANLTSSIRTFVRPIAWRLVKRIMTGAGRGLRFDGQGYSLAYVWGAMERPVQEALLTRLRPGMVFYDVGANSGFFTLIGARLVGTGGRVYAFEPLPSNIEAIRRNVALNGMDQVMVVPGAVGARTGMEQLLVARHPGGATLESAGLAPPDLADRIEVRVLTLDAFVEAGHRPPDVVKIDVEGAEADVIRGMQTLLQSERRPILIYEVDDADEQRFARRHFELDEEIQAKGYRILRLPEAYPSSNWHVGHSVAIPN